MYYLFHYTVKASQKDGFLLDVEDYLMGVLSSTSELV